MSDVDTEPRMFVSSDGANWQPDFAKPHYPEASDELRAKLIQQQISAVAADLKAQWSKAMATRPASVIQPTPTRRIETRDEVDVRCVSVISVGMAWSDSLHNKGYALYTKPGGRALEFEPVEYRIVDALPRIPATKNDSVAVNWVVRYRSLYHGQRLEIVSINDLGRFDPAHDNDYMEDGMQQIGEAMKPIKDRIEAEHAAHVAGRPPSEYETFDKPAAVGEEQEYVDFAKHAEWVDDDKARGKFFAAYNNLCNKYQIEPNHRDSLRKATLIRLCGYDTLKGFLDTAEELLKALEFDFKASGYKPVNQETPVKPSDKPATASDAPTGATPQTETNAGQGVPQSVPGNGHAAAVEKPVLKLVGKAAQITTLTGISIGSLQTELDKRYPKGAYKEIKLDGGRKGTDIGQSYVRDRFDVVFGPHGIGWKFEAHPTIGKVETSQLVDEDGVYGKYSVSLIGHVFKYRVVMPDGSMEWAELSPMSDNGENRKQSYAYRSAFTSLLKQVLRSFGGFNHLKVA